MPTISFASTEFRSSEDLQPGEHEIPRLPPMVFQLGFGNISDYLGVLRKLKGVTDTIKTSDGIYDGSAEEFVSLSGPYLQAQFDFYTRLKRAYAPFALQLPTYQRLAAQLEATAIHGTAYTFSQYMTDPAIKSQVDEILNRQDAIKRQREVANKEEDVDRDRLMLEEAMKRLEIEYPTEHARIQEIVNKDPFCKSLSEKLLDSSRSQDEERILAHMLRGISSRIWARELDKIGRWTGLLGRQLAV